jgi:hypothetical protein
MIRERRILLSIILLAVVSRVFFLSIGRPQFVGWFNHTYYYYVQTRGILNNGVLPFPDMPLVFYLYSATTMVLMAFGMEIKSAIVAASRFWMIVIPSMIPIPIYFIAKSIRPKKKLNKSLWIFVAISAFLPLTLGYLPEFLQKNVLGFLLMAIFVYLSKRILDQPGFRIGFFTIMTFVLIVFTHFGTTIVALLYSISLFIAFLIISKNRKLILTSGGVLLGSFFFAGLMIRLLDNQRFERLFFYLKESVEHSFLLTLFSSGTNSNLKIEALIGIMIPILLTFLFSFLYKKRPTELSNKTKIFWLGQIIFTYLLVLPIYDKLLIGRFTLYLSLPVLIILILTITCSSSKLYIKKMIAGLTIFGSFLMGVGEYMSLKFHNPDKEEIYSDLIKMKEKAVFNSDDFIIAKNGVEHICIWFLDTKSGVITSFNRNDFEKYRNIYILNPMENSINPQALSQFNSSNNYEKYTLMLNNIFVPANANSVYKSEHMQLFLLKEIPEEWKFNNQGDWISYQ